MRRTNEGWHSPQGGLWSHFFGTLVSPSLSAVNVSFRLGFQTGSEIFRKSAVEFIKVRRRFVFPKKMDFCGPANGERDTGVISEWDCVLWIKLHHG